MKPKVFKIAGRWMWTTSTGRRTARVAPRPIEAEPDVCAYESCGCPVRWPQYWCSDQHHEWWLRERRSA